MNISWSLLLLLVYFDVSVSIIMQCNPELNPNCECFPIEQGISFQCPPFSSTLERNGKFSVTITNTKLLISCHENTTFPNFLPNVTVGEIDRLKFQGCDTPPVNIRTIIQHFSLKAVKVVEFHNFVIDLSDDYFEGLFDVDRIKLASLNLSFQGSKVFSEVPNLRNLNMEMNTNLRLKEGLFDNLTELEFLNLMDDDLEEIPKDAFRDLKNLELLYLGQNHLKIITNTTFSGLTNLRKLGLANNQIESVPSQAFEDLINLKFLDLSYNKLTELPASVFENLKKLETLNLTANLGLKLSGYRFANITLLKTANLARCRLEFLPENLFQYLVNLEDLNLSGNRFKFVPMLNLSSLKVLNMDDNLISWVNKSALVYLTSLEKIDLSRNQIRKVFGSFSNDTLKKIYMSENKYCKSVTNILQGTTKVETLDLSFNCVTQVDDIFTKNNTRSLKTLNLSYNNITTFQVKNLKWTKPIDINLDHNNISFVRFNKNQLRLSSSTNVSVSLLSNPLRCDCNNYDFVQHVQKQKKEPSKLTFLEIDNLKCFENENKNILRVSPSLLTCHLNTPNVTECGYIWRPFDNSMVVNCSNRNLTTFPLIDQDIMKSYKFNQTELHLERNQLTDGLFGNDFGYKNVTKLYLSHNKIKSIDWLPPKLEVLNLDNNELSYLNFNVVNILNHSNLVSFVFSHNPWKCDCSNAHFTNFLRNFSKKTDVQKIHCFNNPETLLVNLHPNDFCWQWTNDYYYIIILIIFIPVTLCLVLYHINPRKTKFYLYMISGRRWFQPDDFDHHKIYDAFVSYSHKDEDFVTKTLVPTLEGYQKPYKLCLHYRNWVPGELITTNILNSVQDSRRTVIVLSRNFLESVWSKMEFRVAHAHAMREKRTRLIVIVYGDVDLEEVGEELKTYMKINTYVKWGDSYFWDKLRYALPRKGRASSDGGYRKACHISYT